MERQFSGTILIAHNPNHFNAYAAIVNPANRTVNLLLIMPLPLPLVPLALVVPLVVPLVVTLVVTLVVPPLVPLVVPPVVLVMPLQLSVEQRQSSSKCIVSFVPMILSFPLIVGISSISRFVGHSVSNKSF